MSGRHSTEGHRERGTAAAASPRTPNGGRSVSARGPERRHRPPGAPATALSVIAGLAILVTAACAPGAQGPGQQMPPGGASAPTLLTMGIIADAEPTGPEFAFGNISAGASESKYLLHAPLTIYNDRAQLEPRVAQSIPTLENGDWTVSPDGRMEVTWRLRPDVKWHDGTAMTADDLVFGYRVARDPELAVATRSIKDVDEVVATDPHTVVVRWKQVFIYANEMGLNAIPPLPRHLMEPLYDESDPQAFEASPYWSDQWVGLGPYRMQEYVRGSFIDTVAFDDYFLGRPQIDRIRIQFIGDTRSLIVTTMAGDIDVVPVGSMKAEEAFTLKTEWEAAGAGSVIISNNKLRNADLNWRDPSAPWVQDVRIRQAMVLLLDRQNQVETLHNGLSAVDDIFFPREHPAYQLAKQRGLPDLSYDVDKAHRLFQDAGLTRGPDGVYQSQTGAPFALDVSATGDINTNIQEMLVISNAWQQAGMQPNNIVITSDKDKDEVRGRSQGAVLTSTALGYTSFNGYITDEIRSESTRWKGANIGGYTNSNYDQLRERVFGTVAATERDQIAADLIKFQLDNMVYLPLAYSPDVAASAKTVRGVTGTLPDQRLTSWNAHLWEKS
ncbi:MAG: hypothetical protein GEU73_06280 [Chloroflexi bacterium]|nr:hypothetical protein [Chloroflexota bacterium]